MVHRRSKSITEKALAIPATQGARHALPLVFGVENPWRENAGPLFNMRAESFMAKPAFKNIPQRQRCLIPVDGFFEWHRTPSGTIPYRFRLKDEEPFGLAAIQMDGRFAIITTAANALVAPVHERMPVILRRSEEDLWLDAGVTEYSKLIPLLSPYAPEDMLTERLSPAVNSAKNKSLEVIQPVATPDA